MTYSYCLKCHAETTASLAAIGFRTLVTTSWLAQTTRRRLLRHLTSCSVVLSGIMTLAAALGLSLDPAQVCVLTHDPFHFPWALDRHVSQLRVSPSPRFDTSSVSGSWDARSLSFRDQCQLGHQHRHHSSPGDPFVDFGAMAACIRTPEPCLPGAQLLMAVQSKLSDLCRIDSAYKLLTSTDAELRDMALADAYALTTARLG
ncbi:hypothetical protein HPB51_026551 [Rhipicephalus microplus]|uniref:Uncharacterized protein n=1 Tax=Rhipicephalus microplus TaxID=6941 RepID=A0A9J6D2U4_RHIMP|nr:hypothetical protein HPB51_026551 [Rhipicephalus microplus]